MKSLLGFLFLFAMLACSSPSDKMYMPAEWEPHDAVWLGWEDNYTEYHPVVVNIIKAISPTVQVKIVAASDSLLRVAKSILAQRQIDTLQIKFYVMKGERYWIRDHGAAFLVNEKGELGVADFAWNGYGYTHWIHEKYDHQADSVNKYLQKASSLLNDTGKVDSLMAVAEKAKRITSIVKHEGGAIEVNGKGTLILCEATVFQRNPSLTKEEIEAEFKKALGVKHIIWMKRGLADDPLHFFRRITGNYIGGGTGGHTDEFVRFVNPNTVLLAWVDEKEKSSNPIHSMNYERMSENYEILKTSTDQDVNPLEIIKVPLPDLIAQKVVARKISDDEKTLDVSPEDFKASEAPALSDTLLRVPAASYLNYLVTNGVVVLPSYVHMGSSAEKEEEVKRIFEKAFPGRKIVFIDAMPINWSGGGIHCSTQQQPARVSGQ